MARSEIRSYLPLSAAASWPTFGIVGALNLVVALFPGFDPLTPLGQRWTAVLVGHVVMFAALYLAAAAERSWRPTGFALWLTLLIATGASFLRAVIVNLLLGEVNPWRLVSGIVLGLVLVLVTTLLVGVVRAYRRERQQLEVENARLEAVAAEIDVEIAASDTATARRVERTLVDALSTESERIDADQLDALAHDVVRPLSHELAQQLPTWSPPPLPDSPTQVRFRQILDQSSRRSPFLPVATALVLLTLAAVPVIAAVGLRQTAVYGVIGFVSLTGLLWLANVLVNRLIPGRSITTRTATVAICAVLVGLIFAVLAAAVSNLTGAVVVTESGIRFGLSVLIAVLAWILSVARGLLRQLAEILTRLKQVSNQLNWQVARLRQTQWARQRYIARLFHGPLQTLLMKSAHELRTVDVDDTTGLRDRLKREIQELLTNVEDGDEKISWPDGLSRIISTWDGIVEITVAQDQAVLDVLEVDPVGRSLAIEIVSQAVANAVRHGNATSITLISRISERELWLDIRDNGESEPSDSVGMGTQVLIDCTTFWSRDIGPDGTRVKAHIPVLAAHP